MRLSAVKRQMIEEASTNAEKQAKQDRCEYSEILKAIPEYAPKNYGSYRRMKKADSNNFKQLYERAAEVGVEIIFNPK